MNIIDKVCGKMGLMDPEDDKEDMDDIFDDEPQPNFVKKQGEENLSRDSDSNRNVVDFQSAASAREGHESHDNVVAAYKMKVIVIEPKSFDDAQQVANSLREKKPVVINFENTEAEAAKRIIDFISGTTYALNGPQYTGSRGFEIGASWTPMKNLVGKLEWFTGKDLRGVSQEIAGVEQDHKVSTIFTEWSFIF